MKGIDYFNRGHWLTDVQERLSLSTRKKMYDFWRAEGHLKILDVGTTPDCERMDSNCFLIWLLRDGHDISALSPEDLSELPTGLQKIHVLPKMESRHFNLNDQTFDWVFSSAVLEHVGGQENQKELIRECGRVGNGIFLTTPNRCHWLEFHTKLPVLHWLPKKLHRRLLNMFGLDFWAKEENLNLMTKKELWTMASTVLGDSFNFQIRVVWALGMPSNLVLIAKRKV